MNILPYDVENIDKDTVIPLGRACECRATRIDFMLSDWLTRFPGGEIAVYVRTPGGEVYRAEVDVQDGVASWTITENDTAEAGYGRVEVALFGADGEKKLSSVARTLLDVSLLQEEPQEPPEPYKGWTQKIEQQIDEIKAASGSLKTDETLTLENGILSVNRAYTVEKDNTLPITSAAVYTEVGNINALLETI